MGMLDDAIREHLDLKRRQGADPSEIAQLETEALGGGNDAKPELDDDAELLEVEESADLEVTAADEPGQAEPELPIVEEPIAEEVVELEPEAGQPTEQFSPEEVEAAMRPEPIAEPEPAPVAAPAPDPEPIAQPEPELFETEVAAEAEESATEARDELEETPDFLEETPEHDRLWFERKPPRDFDF